MTQDEIIRMAREAGFTDAWLKPLERFATLAFAAGAAHEREKAKVVFEELEREVKIELINAINGAVELEREACAKVCDDAAPEYEEGKNMAVVCAAAIRARGNK